jgi:hypothetical protein
VGFPVFALFVFRTFYREKISKEMSDSQMTRVRSLEQMIGEGGVIFILSQTHLYLFFLL